MSFANFLPSCNRNFKQFEIAVLTALIIFSHSFSSDFWSSFIKDSGNFNNVGIISVSLSEISDVNPKSFLRLSIC